MCFHGDSPGSEDLASYNVLGTKSNPSKYLKPQQDVTRRQLSSTLGLTETPSMPSRIELAESLWLMYICLQNSDYKAVSSPTHYPLWSRYLTLADRLQRGRRNY